MSPRRLLSVLVLALVPGLLAACSSTLEDAASVGDVHIRRADFESQLRDLVGNESFVEMLSQSGFEVPDSDGVVSTQVAVIWLNNRIRYAASDAEFDARDLLVSDADRQAARAGLEGGFGGAEVFAEFPQSLIDEVIEYEARYQALRAALREDARTIDEADARLVYEANRDAFGACESDRSVAHILVATEAEAQDVLDELAGGADFGELAGERSTDPGSAAAGGSLGCLGATEFVPEFAAAAGGAALDEPVGPVETQYGFHVILVTRWEAPTFEDVRDSLVADLESAGAEGAAEALTSATVGRRLAEADVTIDPRYGIWDAARNTVVAPEVPVARDGRDGGGGGGSTAGLDPLAG